MLGGSDVYLPGVLADKLWTFKKEKGQQLILLLRCLTADCNLGYYTGGACKMLEVFNLKANRLSGTIPPSLGKLGRNGSVDAHPLLKALLWK